MMKKVKHNTWNEGNTEVASVFAHHRHELLDHQRGVLANILLTLQREERGQDHYKKRRKPTTHSHSQEQLAIAIKPTVRLHHFTAMQINSCWQRQKQWSCWLSSNNKWVQITNPMCSVHSLPPMASPYSGFTRNGSACLKPFLLFICCGIKDF